MNEPTMITGIQELGIFEKDADAWVDSRDIAKVFDKRHANVLAAIKSVVETAPTNFVSLNFKTCTYVGDNNKKSPSYRMNRKGFALVVMGFTGEKAIQFRVAYIEAFERMSDLIFARRVTAHGHHEMTAAIAEKMSRDPMAFADESDRVNLAVLGMKSREFRHVFSVPKGKNPRDAVPMEILEKIDAAQRLNGALIRAGLSGDERTRILEANYKHKAMGE